MSKTWALPPHAQYVALGREGSRLHSWLAAGGAYATNGHRRFALVRADGSLERWWDGQPGRPKPPPEGEHWAWQGGDWSDKDSIRPA